MPAAEAARIIDRFTAGAARACRRPTRPLPDYQRFERHVLVDDLDGVKVITLRRPEALNALHDEMTDEILGVIRRFEHDRRVIGFVLIGYGTRAFCAGADIGRFPSLLGDAEASAQYARDCSRLLVHLDAMDKPVVAALNGMALGGGFELAMRCHGLVAMRDAWMQLPEITLGILPGIGAMVVPVPPLARCRRPSSTRCCGGRRSSRPRARTSSASSTRWPTIRARCFDLAAARVRALAGAARTRSRTAPSTIPPLDAVEPSAPRTGWR